MARVNLEMHLPINVPHLGGEILHPAQKGRQDAADRLVLPAQGRDPGRQLIGEPFPDGAFHIGTGQEVVQRHAGSPLAGGCLGNNPQMGGREVAVGPVEAALGEPRTFDGRRGNDGGKPQDVGIAIHRHPVQGEQVIAGAAAAHVHRRSAIGPGGNARKALRPADGVSFAHGGNHIAEGFLARCHTPQRHVHPARVRFHRRLKRIPPMGLLGRQGQAYAGQSNECRQNPAKALLYSCSHSNPVSFVSIII